MLPFSFGSPRVHFGALVAPDYDIDILPHWIRHYVAYGFDTYTVYLHSPLGNTEAYEQARHLLSEYGFQVRDTRNEKFGNGSLRSSVMREIAKALPARDSLITADSDEIQDVPIEYRELAIKYDYIEGRLLDCYDDTLHIARDVIPLQVQYPHRGDVEQEVLKSVDVKTRQAWPLCRKSKILCARANMPVAYAGSHVIFTTNKVYKRYPFIFDVQHYSWRHSIVKRMAGKDYFRAEHIWYVMKFFEPDDKRILENPEMKALIDHQESMDRQKGWEPCSAMI